MNHDYKLEFDYVKQGLIKFKKYIGSNMKHYKGVRNQLPVLQLPVCFQNDRYI